MIDQDKKSKTNTRYVPGFKGLNRLPVHGDGELMSSMNMKFDLYPAMSVRNGRTMQRAVSGEAQGFLFVGEDDYVIGGGILYKNGSVTSLTGLSSGGKSMVEFWDKIFVFPDKKYYDTLTGESGDIGSGTFPADGSCPDIDFAVVHNNRIWGVHGNFIYASSNGYAMGAKGSDDRYGWTQFYDAAGNPDDNGSYFLEVGSEGSFTGIASWDNRIVALKDLYHYEINGSYPSNYSLSTISKVGTIDHRSMAEVNGRLMYTSHTGVYIYAGGMENECARKLHEEFDNAVCGTDGIRYYLCVRHGEDVKLYMYHSLIDMWTEETPLDAVSFVTNKGFCYALCSDGKVWRLNDPNSTEEVEWNFTFSDYADTVFVPNTVKRLLLKLRTEKETPLTIAVVTDGDQAETLTDIVVGTDVLTTIDTWLPLNRGDEHIFRVSGKGPAEIYGYYLVSVKGGDNLG